MDYTLQDITQRVDYYEMADGSVYSRSVILPTDIGKDNFAFLTICVRAWHYYPEIGHCECRKDRLNPDTQEMAVNSREFFLMQLRAQPITAR